ncbi:MAG: hypothetical protein KDA61_14925, partial [Planctomycetales bacterium]|nr:hypothetical protein [Planctomycetales bacterium]
MNSVNRMTLNVCVTLARMCSTVVVGLYSTRLLVHALGDVDYGIWGLLFGGAVMLTVLQASIGASAVRYLSVGIGRDDAEELQVVFSTCWVVFAIAAGFLLVFGALATPAVVATLEYPEARRTAVIVVWLSMVANMTIVAFRAPYNSVFVARQAMLQESFFAVGASLSLLLAAWTTERWSGDRLIFYGGAMVVIRAVELAALIVTARVRFAESRLSLRKVRRSLLREIAGFGGWSIFDAISIRLRQLGPNLLVNLFFGPVMNAACAIGGQVQNYAQTLTLTVSRATSPVMMQTHFRGNADFVRRMAVVVSRISVLLLLLITIPLFVDAEFILRVWIGDTPDYTADFCRWMAMTIILDQLSAGYAPGIQADGRIRLNMLVTFALTIAP